MKTCPNCKEILGDSVNKCFNCRYSFEIGRVLTAEEIKEYSNMTQQEIAEKQREVLIEKQRIEQEERLEYERIQEEYRVNRGKNALYEYEVVILRDKNTGGFDVDEYRRILTKYSAEGWQLKTVFSNEIGKKSSSVSFGGTSYGTNATIDNTIITFERCIRPSSL